MCLFVVEVLYYFLSYLKEELIVLLSIAFGVLGVLTIKATFFDFSTLPWSIDVAFMALPFYMAGNLLVKHFPHEMIVCSINRYWGRSVLVFVVSSFIVYCGANYNGIISMGHSYLGRSPSVFYITAFVGIIAFVIFSIAINNLSLKIVSGIKWIGRNSFRVMAIHNPIKGVLVLLLVKFTGGSTLDFINFIIAFALTCIITIFVGLYSGTH